MSPALRATTVGMILALAAAAQTGPGDLWDQYRKAAMQAEFRGKLIDAEKFWRAALVQAEILGPNDSRLPITLSNVGSVCLSGGRFDEAIGYFKRALSLSEHRGPPGSHLTINALNNLAMVYQMKGQEAKTADQSKALEAEAERYYKQALGLAEPAAERDPQAPAQTLHNLGNLYLSQKRFPEAETLFARLVELVRSDPNKAIFGAANELAIVYEQEGKYGDAERVLLDDLAAPEQQGSVDRRLGEALERLADHHAAQGEYERAAMLYERALGVFEQLKTDGGPFLAAPCLSRLGELYDKWNMPDKAEDAYQRELKLEMEILGPNAVSMPFAIFGLGNLYREQGHLEDIEPLVQNVLSIQEERLGADHFGMASTLVYLAQIEGELGKKSEPESLLRRAIAIQEKSFGPNHPQLVSTLVLYAGTLRAAGREAEAAKIDKRVEQIQAHKGQ